MVPVKLIELLPDRPAVVGKEALVGEHRPAGPGSPAVVRQEKAPAPTRRANELHSASNEQAGARAVVVAAVRRIRVEAIAAADEVVRQGVKNVVLPRLETIGEAVPLRRFNRR